MSKLNVATLTKLFNTLTQGEKNDFLDNLSKKWQHIKFQIEIPLHQHGRSYPQRSIHIFLFVRDAEDLAKRIIDTEELYYKIFSSNCLGDSIAFFHQMFWDVIWTKRKDSALLKKYPKINKHGGYYEAPWITPEILHDIYRDNYGQFLKDIDKYFADYKTFRYYLELGDISTWPYVKFGISHGTDVNVEHPYSTKFSTFNL